MTTKTQHMNNYFKSRIKKKDRRENNENRKKRMINHIRTNKKDNGKTRGILIKTNAGIKEPVQRQMKSDGKQIKIKEILMKTNENEGKVMEKN